MRNRQVDDLQANAFTGNGFNLRNAGSADTYFLAGACDFEIGNSMSAYVRAECQYRSDTMADGNNEPLKLRPSFAFVNLKARIGFEKIDAELSVRGRNLTDGQFYETVFDVPVQDGKLNAYPHEPRTWGVTFRKNFQ